jgi:carbon storage regulator CsrA
MRFGTSCAWESRGFVLFDPGLVGYADRVSHAADRSLDLGRRSPTMLVITRREGEEVVIGDPASPLGVVRIVTIKGDRVRVAFEFPRTVEVHRREVADQILSSNNEEGRNVIGSIRPATEGG